MTLTTKKATPKMAYHGWKDYREMIISQDGFNTNEGDHMRQFKTETE